MDWVRFREQLLRDRRHRDVPSVGVTFRLQTTALFFVNDMPKIKGMDEPTSNRLRYIETEYSYLSAELYESKKHNPIVRKADPDLKQVWLKRKDVLEAFASLVVNAYENDEPIAPECVMRDSKEWTDFDDVKNRLLGLFESTGDERDIMTPEAIHQVSHMNGVEVSKTKIGRLLKSNGFSKIDKKINGVKKRFYTGIKQIIISNDY